MSGKKKLAMEVIKNPEWKIAETCDQHKICFKQDVNKVYHSFSAKAILSYV